MKKKNLQIDQLSAKMRSFNAASKIDQPPTGWIRAIRLSLGITLEQLATQLSISKQSAQRLEKREKNGEITVKSLREAATALDMQLVYGLVPKDGSLDVLIERKARELATLIVKRTSNNMKLEGQENSDKRIKKAIDERTNLLKKELPKILWD